MASPHNPKSPPPTTRERGLVEILRAVAAGHQQALGDLYDATSNVVFGLLFRILSAREEAEEVLLDVYSQVWRQAAQYSEARGTPMAWLTTIARSRAIDRLRSSQTERKRAEPLDVVIGHATKGRGVEEVAQASELGRAVRSALNQLTPEQREVIELAYYEGMSHGEIAAHTSQPLGTVKTRTRLGMMRLRELLKSTYEAVR